MLRSPRIAHGLDLISAGASSRTNVEECVPPLPAFVRVFTGQGKVGQHSRTEQKARQRTGLEPTMVFSEAMLRTLHEACAVRNAHGLKHAPVTSPDVATDAATEPAAVVAAVTTTDAATIHRAHYETHRAAHLAKPLICVARVPGGPHNLEHENEQLTPTTTIHQLFLLTLYLTTLTVTEHRSQA